MTTWKNADGSTSTGIWEDFKFKSEEPKKEEEEKKPVKKTKKK